MPIELLLLVRQRLTSSSLALLLISKRTELVRILSKYSVLRRNTNSLHSIVLVTAYSMWNLVEIHVGIIAACGMTLRPILGRIVPTATFMRFVRSFTSLRSSSGSGNRHAGLPSFVQMESLSNSQPERRARNEQLKEEQEQEQARRNMSFQTSALPEAR